MREEGANEVPTLEDVRRTDSKAWSLTTDWVDCFEVSCRDIIRSATPWDKTVRLDPAKNTDVKRVIKALTGQNDSDKWIGLFELNDGRFVSIAAWCDYTGWGCQDGGEMTVANSEEDIVRYGLNDEERKRLKLEAVPSALSPTPSEVER